MNKKKICFIIDTLEIGGAGLLTVHLVGYLAKLGYICKIVVLNEKSENSKKLLEIIPKNVSIVNYNLYSQKFLKRIKYLKNEIRDYDIIHTCLELANFYGSLVNLLCFRKKFIATIHGIDGVFIEDEYLSKVFKKKSNRKYYFTIRYLTTLTLKYYDHFISVCNSVKEFLISKRRINPKKISVIIHGIDLSEMNKEISLKEIEIAKKELGIEENDFTLGYCGRLSYAKGLEKLLDIFGEIKSTHKNFKLILIGDGERKEYLNEVIRNLSLEDSCKITGFKENLNLYYKMLDVFVLPSMSESTSMVTQEAMYNKVIPICTDVGGIPEIIKNGYNGFLFQKNDFKELKNKILYVYENRFKLQYIRDNAYNTIIGKFNLTQNVKNISDLIKRL